MWSIEETRRYFQGDRFVEMIGIHIDSIAENGAVCSVEIGDQHLNKNNYPQGGLLFSLADFTFAVSANITGNATVTLDANIHYLKATHSKKLIAKGLRRHSSRKICVYDVNIIDSEGICIALATFTGFITGT